MGRTNTRHHDMLIYAKFGWIIILDKRDQSIGHIHSIFVCPLKARDLYIISLFWQTDGDSE